VLAEHDVLAFLEVLAELARINLVVLVVEDVAVPDERVSATGVRTGT